MRSVRCEVCGVKALIAASTCPKCHHELGVRDASGELLRLAYCSSCDSYYPERLGACRWCGTKPERAPLAPRVWRVAGAVAFVALAAVGWIARGSEPQNLADAKVEARLDSVARSRDTMASRTTMASAGSIDADSAVLQGATSAPAASPAPSFTDTLVATDTIASTLPATPSAELAPGREPSKPATTPRTSRTRASTRWVSSVSRNWVVVRAQPSRGARVVASIGPSSRVQLGESRGDWRRIRARGITGWVEHRAFFAGGRAARKTRGLAAR